MSGLDLSLSGYREDGSTDTQTLSMGNSSNGMRPLDEHYKNMRELFTKLRAEKKRHAIHPESDS